MARLPTEFEIQRAVCLWLPTVLIPGVMWWHTPNGGARDAREGARFKQIGVKAGIPDLWFLWGALYGLELKAAGGVLSEVQRDLHLRLVAAGAQVAVANSLDAAKQIICGWGLTVKSSRDNLHP